MGANIEKTPVDVLARDLIHEREDINNLNLAKKNHREAFLLALKERPNLLSKVKDSNAEHFFNFAVEKKYEYFVYLSRKQYTEDLAQFYLLKRLEEKPEARVKGEAKSKDFVVQKSMDDKIIFNYTYVTPEEEELYYLDTELQVPTSVKSSIRVTLKLTSALALIDKLDTHITLLGERKIKAVIDNIIGNSYKAYLNSYINEKKIGYYTLCTSFEDLQNGFVKKLNEVFGPYGITASDFVIKKIAIPKDIQYKIEDQAFRVRQRRAEFEADTEFAKRSLENYEAKLVLQEKYPNAEHSLTEYEKDLALKRYLIKTGREAEESLDHVINIQQKAEAGDSRIEKVEDIIPEIVPKQNIFRKNFIMCAIISAVISFVVMFSSVGAGLIILGCATLLFGAIAAFNYPKFATPKTEGDQEGEVYNGNNG